MKIKKNHFYIGIIIVVIAVGLFFYFRPFNKVSNSSGANQSLQNNNYLWMVDKSGYLYYPLNRSNINFKRENYSETENLLVSKITYQSTNGNVYGLLVLPKLISGHLPGVVLLPGAGVSKESELKLAEEIAKLGAAVLTIDQRGVGETGGTFPSLDEDYQIFLESKEPYQHLMVYDALRGYDVLYSAPFVDPGSIIIAGESLGGRVAVIAAAIDRNIKGAMIISSAGFDFTGGPDEKKNAFIKSVDSDHYIDLITPRKIVMIHNKNDKIIPLSSALKSYARAQQPKQFILVNDTSCNHGYCDSMHEGLVVAYEYLTETKANAVGNNMNLTSENKTRLP